MICILLLYNVIYFLLNFFAYIYYLNCVKKYPVGYLYLSWDNIVLSSSCNFLDRKLPTLSRRQKRELLENSSYVQKFVKDEKVNIIINFFIVVCVYQSSFGSEEYNINIYTRLSSYCNNTYLKHICNEFHSH